MVKAKNDGKAIKADSRKRRPARPSGKADSLHMKEALAGSKDEPLGRAETIRMGLGVLLLALSAFTLLSLVSHLFTGGDDQKVLQNHYLSSASNWAGYVGAWWSDYWTTRNFGLGAFLIPIFLFAAALKLTGAYHVRLWKWFVNCTILLCWISVAAAFFLDSTFAKNPAISYINPGGYHGQYIVGQLKEAIGPVGTFLVIALTLLVYLCYLSAETVRIIKRLLHPKSLVKDMVSKLPYADRIGSHKGDDDADNDSEKTASDEATAAVALTFGPDEVLPADNISAEVPLTETGDVPLAQQDEGNQKPEREPKKRQKDAEPEFEVEQGQEEQKADAKGVSALAPYDPKLDLEHYHYPTLDLLKHYDIDARAAIDMVEQTRNKDQIVNVLRNFGVEISSIKATIGPTITLYEITPAPGVRISKIRNLEDDIALSLSALGIRIIAPIPGKGTIGIEVPNAKPQIVSMESILNSKKFQESTFELPMALGKTITNEVFMVDLAKMPHLLVAGATGQGKSVGLNAIITSLLYKKHPAELKLVMVDPKKVEFSVYSPIVNHFLAQIEDEDDEPIITDVQKVVNTLKSLCIEMDSRYDLLKKARARNLKEYNQKFKERQLNPENGHRFLPYIVVIIDEFGDLIMTAGKEIELPIARIAQLARAVGIHMIIATQRPTTNIITGTIKANFPARMAFKVSAMIDSRTILDRPGANQLVGKGDMLFLAGNEPVRVQCAFVDTPEVERIANFIACQQSYNHPFALPRPPMEDAGGGAADVDMNHLDPMFAEVARLVVNSQSGSTSMIQRKFSIGFNRAGRLMDQLERAGVVGPSQGAKPREVLIQDETSLEMLLSSL